MTAARVEVELNMANQIAKFDVRSIKSNFAASIQDAETEEAIIVLVDETRAEIDAFEANLSTTLSEVIDLARNDPALQDRIAEAEQYSQSVSDAQRVAFEDAYGEAEIMATSRAT